MGACWNFFFAADGMILLTREDEPGFSVWDLGYFSPPLAQAGFMAMCPGWLDGQVEVSPWLSKWGHWQLLEVMLFEPELASNAERRVLPNTDAQGALSYHFLLVAFPAVANHLCWKWWHGGRGKEKATHSSFSFQAFLTHQQAEVGECRENICV